MEEFLASRDLSKFKITPFIKKIPKPWGYELLFTPEDLPYSGKIMHIESGKRLSLQVHDTKIETYYLLNGECNLLYENTEGEMETLKLETGQGYTMIVGQKHRHQAITDCDVLEVAMPETGTTYRLEDDYNRGHEDEELRKDPNRGWNQ